MEYKKQLKKFDLRKITTLSFVLFIVPFVISTLLNLIVFKRSFTITDKFYFDMLIALAVLIVGLAMHEGLHALVAITVGRCPVKKIKFGMQLKQGMLYCHADNPIKVGAYRAVLITPMIVTGLIPLIISVVFGNVFLIVAFSFLLSGGAGDLIMLNGTKGLDSRQLVYDHPKAPAFYLLYKEGETPADFSEVTEEEEKSLADAMNAAAFSSGQNNNLIKILLIAIFICLVVALVFFIGIMMKLL